MAKFCLSILFLVLAIAVSVRARGYRLKEEGNYQKRSRSHGPEEGLVFDCADKDNGFYADVKRGCHQYYHCYLGMKSTYHCPPGSLFDETTESCNKEHYVVCSQLVRRTQSHGSEDWLLFKCQDRPNGFYGDVNRGCHQYYQCVDGKKITHFCPENYLFDFKSQACAPKEIVRCEKVEKRTESHGQDGALVFKCDGRQNGFYGDVKRGCHQYYQCVDGEKITHFCPTGYLFHSKSQACAPKATVHCGEPVRQEHKPKARPREEPQEENLDELERVLEKLARELEKEQERGR